VKRLPGIRLSLREITSSMNPQGSEETSFGESNLCIRGPAAGDFF
jgi:hypothetical protein